MIKISDCNNCDKRNCQIYGRIKFNCKQWLPPQRQPLAWLGQVALFTNAQGLYNTLDKYRLEMPR